MTKTVNQDGSYMLAAAPGYDLAVVIDSTVQDRAKAVEIPAAGTLNDWVEVPEKPPDPVPVEETTEERIARLRAEIEALEAQPP